jgi:hypothetical protein
VTEKNLLNFCLLSEQLGFLMPLEGMLVAVPPHSSKKGKPTGDFDIVIIGCSNEPSS